MGGGDNEVLEVFKGGLRIVEDVMGRLKCDEQKRW